MAVVAPIMVSIADGSGRRVSRVDRSRHGAPMLLDRYETIDVSNGKPFRSHTYPSRAMRRTGATTAKICWIMDARINFRGN